MPRRADYGLRAVLYLSVQDPQKCCSITEIAKQQGVPKKFLAKIIQDLIRCGLVKSKRGACRGYTLARSPEQISFYDVIEAIEGPSQCEQLPRSSMVKFGVRFNERPQDEPLEESVSMAKSRSGVH
jgi:Rrf2 family protein